MLKHILTQIKRNRPFVSIVLILSCCIATIPQFILDGNYSFITGQRPTIDRFYLVALNAFTHSPDILVNHFVGNLLVIIVFGVLTETLIGSRRFALLSAVAFMATTVINYLHYTGGTSHGISGMVWGYHVFFVVFLIALYREKGRAVFSDRYMLVALLLLVFDVLGIMLLEVTVLHQRFFQNFGQVLHIVSMASAIPFILLWRNDISTNIRKYLLGQPIEFPKQKWGVGVVAIAAIACINLYGTIIVIASC